ncbi:MAG: peptidoglycan D,D-transpeptidase FtsI family protein [Acidobacteriota bacterium]
MLPTGRLRLIVAALAVWAAVVWLRLADVQLIEHGQWAAEAMEQQEGTIRVQEPRGEIVTRDGRVLAGSLERVSLCANPRRIPSGQWPAVARALAPLAGLPAAQILDRFRSSSGFLYVAKDLDPEVAAAVARLRHDGLWTERTERRVYPNGTLAAPVVGFVNAEGIGQAGLEALFDSTLQGVPSLYHRIRDGKSVGTAVELSLQKAGRPGLTLRLSLDSRVQMIVEDELERTMETIGGHGASVVVMDPWSGEVLALASLPSYDPARPGDVVASARRNRAVEDAIEPGSTFKPIVIASALKNHAIGPYEMIDCSGGGVQIAGFFIHDHARYGLLPVREVIAQSSNAGAIRIAMRLEPAQLDASIRAFGFGKPTGIEQPAETGGLYRGPARWSALSRAGLAIGQEISVSAIQLAQAYAVLANGGVLVHPRLVLETVDGSDGHVVTPAQPRPGERVVSPEITHEIAGMLQAVVDEGTGKSARVEGYEAAGKTGTAQKAVNGGYGAGRHAAWFAGFLPRDHPRLVIVVCVDRPEKTFWAADVAAPTFGRIANRLVTLMGLPPEEGTHT